MRDHQELIRELAAISSPIVYDAVEKFNVRGQETGYTDASIKCIMPELGAICGYARTGKITGNLPKSENEEVLDMEKVWRYVDSMPKPGIMVVEDIDAYPKRSCAWGDYSASIFKALGCVGAVTNGCVRDVDEVRALGFSLFASTTVVGHAYIRYVGIDMPVTIGGLVVRPGDLIHADLHGVGIIPKEIPLDALVEKVKQCLETEGKVISYCNSPRFSLDGLLKHEYE